MKLLKLPNKDLFLIYVLILIASIFTQLIGFNELGLWLLLIVYLFFIKVTIDKIGINSIYFFYILFFGLYTFSLPISVELGFDVGKYREKYLDTWPFFDDSLRHYVFSSSLAFIGIFFSFFLSKYIHKKVPDIININKNHYFRLSLISGLFASIFEVINFIRVGGFYALDKGKAFYQSSISDIAITLPSEGLFFISIGLFAYTIGNKKFLLKEYLSILFFIFVNSFYFFINLYTGERGTILVAIIIFLLGYTYYKRFYFLKISYIFSFFIIFILFGYLTIYRNLLDDKKGATFKTSINYLKTHSDRLWFVINPANVEFAAPALVYRVWIKNNEGYSFMYGQTYLYFLPNMIPSYINPYRAPTLVNEIRDNYFKDRSKKGSNASVGFSSLLESIINFGMLGAFLFGFLTSFLLLKVEKIRDSSLSKYNVLLYLLSFNIVLILFRSSSEFIMQQIIMYIFYVIFIILISSFLFVIFRRNNFFNFK